jgi:hypothetical protein
VQRFWPQAAWHFEVAPHAQALVFAVSSGLCCLAQQVPQSTMLVVVAQFCGVVVDVLGGGAALDGGVTPVGAVVPVVDDDGCPCSCGWLELVSLVGLGLSEDGA